MTQTVTRTATYTKVDVDKTFESFRSFLRLISTTSGLSMERVDDRTDDVLAFANAGYLKDVSLILTNANGVRIRAAKFTVSESATGWSSDMPGDNIWPTTQGGTLSIVVNHNANWDLLSQTTRAKFLESLRLSWGPSDADTSFS